jgi:dihydrofolate reductase
MRKIIYCLAASLDGCIAREDGAIDWLPVPGARPDWGRAAFLRRIDTLVVGRKAYEQLLDLGPWPYGRRACYVLSRRWAGQRDIRARFFGGNVPALLRRLKRRPGRDIWLMGGGESAHAGLAAGLVDEIIVTVIPVVLGGGRPLFPPGLRFRRLRLRRCRALPGGPVQLHYAVAARSPGRSSGSHQAATAAAKASRLDASSAVRKSPTGASQPNTTEATAAAMRPML